MLEKIEYIFPKNNKNIEFFWFLFNLFKNLPYVTLIENNELHIIPANLNPKTVFRLDDNITNIQFYIGSKKYSNLLNRHLNNSTKSSSVKRLHIKDVLQKLVGHITGIDHTGINLPTKLYSQDEWSNLLDYLSSISNIYNYPTGEPWPFLIPSTIEENQQEIMNFNIIRKPKFEFVHDAFTNIVTIHIQIETDLSKSEVEELFPENEGIYFKNLEDVYKAIYLDYNPYLNIRLDIGFKGLNEDFDTGKWFISEGKRIKSINYNIQ